MSENRIITKGAEHVRDEDGEVDAGSGGVTPGELVEFYGNADYDVHGTAGGTRPEPRFARKKGEVGGEITDAYVAGEGIKVALCPTGVKVYTFLAAGENVAEGELVSSAGNGALRSAEDGTAPDGEDAAVARAAEAVDNGAGTTAVRLEVEVL